MASITLAPLSTADAHAYWSAFLEGRTDVPTRDVAAHVERYLALPPEEQRTHFRILLDGRLVGTLRLLPGTITGFSLIPGQEGQARAVLVKAVDMLRSQDAGTIAASYEDRYGAAFEALGFRRRFARMRMEAATRTYAPRPGVALKPPEEAEVVRLTRFLMDVYEGHLEQAFGLHVGSEGEWREYVTGILKGETGRFMPEASYLAMDGERIAGAVLVAHWMGMPIVSEVGVVADRRGHGLGRAMLEVASSRLAALGEVRWSLYVTLGNDPAVHLYTSLGFTRVGGETVTAVLPPP